MCFMPTRVLPLALISAVVLSDALFGQQAPRPDAYPLTFVRLVQGEEIELPEDFVARLDGNQLKVALKSFAPADAGMKQNLLVSLIQEDGSRVKKNPDANGELTFDNVQEGLAALVVASGQATFSALAFYTVQNDGEAAPAFEVGTATIDPSNIRAGVESAGTVPPGAFARPLSDFPKRAKNRFRVYLQPNGLLNGRVVVPEDGFQELVGSVSLTFFREGVLVADSISADDGTFVVGGLTPGIHSVFASGPAGHTAFVFEVVAPKVVVVPASKPMRSRGGKLVLTAAQDPEPADELIVLLIPPRLMPGVRDAVGESYAYMPESIVGSPMNSLPPGGGFGEGGFGGGGGMGGGGMGGGLGGGGGGFGGGGGLGGLGGLLGIAGLATGIAALSDDDGAPATPIAP